MDVQFSVAAISLFIVWYVGEINLQELLFSSPSQRQFSWICFEKVESKWNKKQLVWRPACIFPCIYSFSFTPADLSIMPFYSAFENTGACLSQWATYSYLSSLKLCLQKRNYFLWSWDFGLKKYANSSRYYSSFQEELTSKLNTLQKYFLVLCDFSLGFPQTVQFT